MDSVSQTFDRALQLHQAGDLRQAEPLYRQVLQIDPQHVHALHLIGVIAHQIGNNDLAVDYIQRALRLHPEFSAAHHNLGSALMAQGKLAEAQASFQQALRLKPDYAEAHYSLGNALKGQRKLEEAIASYQQALLLKPDYAEACVNLGSALTDQGKFEEAIANFRQAVRVKPNYAEAYNNLGSALTGQGKFEEAIANIQQALRLKPNFAGAHNNLGNAWRGQGKLDEATASFQQALRLKPDHAGAYVNLGNTLADQGKFDEAIANYRQALQLRPNFADAYYNLGNALQDQENFDGAIANYNRALTLQPELHSARGNLGVVLEKLGDFAGAEQAFRAVLREQPWHAAALWQLATLLGGKLPEADRALLERRLADAELSDADRARLLFGLANVCDAKSDFEKAASLLKQANALMLAGRLQKGQRYDIEGHARFVDNIMAAFTPAFFERMRGFSLDTERPVFIVGLPRSGTTLTEQILAAHSQVFGAGELTLSREIFLALGAQPTDESVFATLPGLSGDTFRRLAQRHLDQLGTMNRTAARVVDKMPENYFNLGLLAAMFPRAKFIHCRRDLRDVAVSCWMTNFRHFYWANDPEHIATRFRQYERLMAYWRAVLPVAVLEVQYEDTVTDLPNVARRLVEWCGLDWEPACLSFHESKHPVRTASSIQVRQPIYTKSVGRWRNYERDLGPLFASLEKCHEARPLGSG